MKNETLIPLLEKKESLPGLISISKFLVPESFIHQQVIIPNDIETKIYFIVLGDCEVLVEFKEEGQHTESLWKRKISTGQVFGEISFFLECHPTALVQAKTYLQVLSLSKENFKYV